MRIGIDFDNTIANYDGVFHRAALERGLIPADLPPSKNTVRDYLNGSGRKNEFTELQGYVYGARMDLVAPYPGVEEAVAALTAAGHDLMVISHKTRVPLKGPAHDMHAAARGFLVANGLVGNGMIPLARVGFHETAEEKVAAIAAESCDVFIDDLPEVLTRPGFPMTTRRILFDPHGHFPESRWLEQGLERHSEWSKIADVLLHG
ncbi:hypothetical protein ACJ4V0_20975 [Phreatobacter sp. HK31-P]